MNNRVPIPRKPFYELSKRQRKRNLRLMTDNQQQNELRINVNAPILQLPIQMDNFIPPDNEDIQEMNRIKNMEEQIAEGEDEEEEEEQAEEEQRAEDHIEGLLLNDDGDSNGDDENGDDYNYNEDGNDHDNNDIHDHYDDNENVDDDDDHEDGDDADGRNNRRPNIENDYDPLLYTNSPITLSQSMLLILTLFLNHNMSQSCLSDIIAVINMHCIRNNLQRNSLYKFKKFFMLTDHRFQTVTKHYYCSLCLNELISAQDACVDCQGKKGYKSLYFIELSFKDQLAELFKRPNFYHQLQSRFHRNDRQPNTISDIYDGNLYQEWSTGEFLASPNNLSFTWYTDGVPVFKSSGVSINPLYLTINELPYKERMKRENMVLAGLSFGKIKPNMNSFVFKLRAQFEELANGRQFLLPDNHIIDVRAILLIGTCDMVAKCQMLNMTQFNGEFGCHICKIPGESFELPSGGTTHVYPYTLNLPLRTSEETEQYGTIALESGIPVMGVKGPCALSKFMPDFIVGTAIDRMHCIDGGVVKKMLTLWFDTAYSAFPFSLYHVKDVINERLLSIKPPKFIHRMPRSTEDLTHWKASELKAWFFYYSVPVLYGIMRNDFFHHLLLLICGVSFLSADSVTHNMLVFAETFLDKFVRQFEELYGRQFCSINLHLIQHLGECVKNLGPLWGYQCYQYEDLNGQLLALINGTTHIDSQILTAHYQLLRMQKYKHRLEDGDVRDFCFGQKRKVKINELLFDGCYTVGVYENIIATDLPVSVRQAIRFLLPTQRLKKYLRLLKNCKIYVSKEYSRSLQTESSYISYQDNNGTLHFRSIFCFIRISNCECEFINNCNCNNSHYAIIKTVIPIEQFHVNSDSDITCALPYLHECEETENYTAIPVSSLKHVCFFISINNHIFLSQPINDKELE